MRQKLLITGGSGLLGSTFARTTAGDFEVYATYHSYHSQIHGCQFLPLDITDRNQVFPAFKKINPGVVIHTAALTLVDYCEDHGEEAWLTNVVGTENVAMAARETGSSLIYISTDAVFNGKKGMYSEEDTPDPLSIYARTKLEGERKVQQWLPDSLIIRTAFYGWNLQNKPSLAEWVVASLREEKPLRMFTDVFFTPILVNNLVEVIMEMYQQNLSGIYNVAGSERCSKHDFGLTIAQAFGLDKGLIRPSSITEAGLRAPRARDLSLDITKINKVTSSRLLNVEQGIRLFRNLEPSLQEETRCEK